MDNTSWAYLSNYLIYSAMAVFTLAFFAHAFETAWAVRTPSIATEKSEGNLLVKTFDFERNCYRLYDFRIPLIIFWGSSTWHLSASSSMGQHV